MTPAELAARIDMLAWASLWGSGTGGDMRGLATLFNEPDPRALLERRLSDMAGLDEKGRVRTPSVAIMGGVRAL